MQAALWGVVNSAVGSELRGICCASALVYVSWPVLWGSMEPFHLLSPSSSPLPLSHSLIIFLPLLTVSLSHSSSFSLSSSASRPFLTPSSPSPLSQPPYPHIPGPTSLPLPSLTPSFLQPLSLNTHPFLPCPPSLPFFPCSVTSSYGKHKASCFKCQ